MFSFKSITLLVAASATLASSIPRANEVAEGDFVKRIAEPAPLSVAGLAQLTTINACVQSYNKAVAPIFLQIGKF